MGVLLKFHGSLLQALGCSSARRAPIIVSSMWTKRVRGLLEIARPSSDCLLPSRGATNGGGRIPQRLERR